MLCESQTPPYCLRPKTRESKGLGLHTKIKGLKLPPSQLKLKPFLCLSYLDKAGDFVYWLICPNSAASKICFTCTWQDNFASVPSPRVTGKRKRWRKGDKIRENKRGQASGQGLIRESLAEGKREKLDRGEQEAEWGAKMGGKKAPHTSSLYQGDEVTTPASSFYGHSHSSWANPCQATTMHVCVRVCMCMCVCLKSIGRES